MLKIFLSIVIVFPVFAKTLSVVAVEGNYKDAPEFQVILTQLKSFGGFSNKAPEVKDDEQRPKTVSRGQQIIEETKARNRALLAQKRQDDKDQEQKTKDSNLSQLDQWKQEVKKTHDEWKQEIIEQRKIWKKEQDIFLGRIKVYKENTFQIPVKIEKIVEKKVIVDIPDTHIVNGAFDVPIRDQQARPTCAAFAGIRAMEILLAQNKIERDLSEQYLYWASKPKCQTSPCTDKGSWVTGGYRYSQNQSQVDVPLENVCEYQVSSLPQNETQVPLATSCHAGTTQVVSFEDVPTIADVVDKLKQHTPVILAAKLTENFYKNQGLITLKDSGSSGLKLDDHALGHAFLAVGLMELPEALKLAEGAFCIVVANSWGKGWGAGGYSCITEKWLTKFRQSSPFVALTKINVKD